MEINHYSEIKFYICSEGFLLSQLGCKTQFQDLLKEQLYPFSKSKFLKGIQILVNVSL